MTHEKTSEEMDRDDRMAAYDLKRRKALRSLRSIVDGMNQDALTPSELVDLHRGRTEWAEYHAKRRGRG